jgi:DNA-binding response OmpR family regulator
MNALITIDSPESLDELVGGLTSWGVSPIVATSSDQATRLLGKLRPDLAIVGGTPPPELLSRLERRGVPIILASDVKELTSAGVLKMVVAALLSPPRPDRMPMVLDLTADNARIPDPPDALEVGPLRLDLVAQVAFVDGERVEVPPKELAILETLALRPGEPIPAESLRRRLWPNGVPATAEDVHRHVYRLRRLIGDHDRRPPLIINRRGFGYVLNASTEARSRAG